MFTNFNAGERKDEKDDIDMNGFEKVEAPSKSKPVFLQQGSVFRCDCGAVIRDETQLKDHSLNCTKMQQAGYSPYLQMLTGIKKKGDIDKQNLKAILDLLMPDPVAQPQGRDEKDVDMDQIPD